MSSSLLGRLQHTRGPWQQVGSSRHLRIVPVQAQPAIVIQATIAMAAAKPTLVYFPPSYAVTKVRFLMEEKDIHYDLRAVNLLLCQNLKPDYVKKVNPNGTVPALVLPDGKVLTESLDIMKWADNVDGKPLGGSEVDKEKVDFWLEKMNDFDGNYFAAAWAPSPVGPLLKDQLEYKKGFVEHYAKKDPELADFYKSKSEWTTKELAKIADASEKKKIKDEAASLLGTAEKQLAETEFVAGPVISIADAMFATLLSRTEVASKELINDYPKVKEYWKKFKARKSYATVVAQYQGAGAQLGLLPSLVSLKFKKAFGFY
ncbi:hypothetical protein KFL_003820050 [Klebsormidium nitens]|uniref:Glutathione S-transferase n=1 Tax=Klebsormidium nitens TaxID=105231 RepID=A0A1Y1IAA3_KLENI|nr:hypothetical protein KFL_003820050 [Klebsormidium nitens]|eukprot:GAQ87850.1 hypothetical protein KFL_003820050 [Klebsormidium nitens]